MEGTECHMVEHLRIIHKAGSIISLESIPGKYPHIPICILANAFHRCMQQTIGLINMPESILTIELRGHKGGQVKYKDKGCEAHRLKLLNQGDKRIWV